LYVTINCIICMLSGVGVAGRPHCVVRRVWWVAWLYY